MSNLMFIYRKVGALGANIAPSANPTYHCGAVIAKMCL